MSQNDIADKNENKKKMVSTTSSHFHPHKLGKVRTVCNAVSKYQGTSFNDNLIPGPDLLQKLVETLFKFREGAVAHTADIKQMFLQAKKKEDETHCLTLLNSDF